MFRALLIATLASCAAPSSDPRLARILDTLAEDNYALGIREPELVAMKLRKMQRGPYEWLRGPAAPYWRDLMEPGEDRTATSFGDPLSSRVLLVGDAHVENVGSFRASDGTMFVDWNDFDATGYGPFTGDVRRLAAAFAVVAQIGAPSYAVLGERLARGMAAGYAEAMATLARGERIGTVGVGASPTFDDVIEKGQSRGDRNYALDQLAPIEGTVRVLALGDLEPVADDGVIEDRVVEVDAEEAEWLVRAVDTWRVRRQTAGVIKLRARRIGSGVSSYPVARYQVVLEGPTDSLGDDLILEIKETREGVVIRGVPILAAAEWNTPAIRSVDSQRRLQARPDADALLDAAQVGALSLKIRNREAYQRGVNVEDLEELAGSKPAQLGELARLYGGLLGRAHGGALTADQLDGYRVIAPLLAGRETAFADEIVRNGLADAALVATDYARVGDLDLGSLGHPPVQPVNGRAICPRGNHEPSCCLAPCRRCCLARCRSARRYRRESPDRTASIGDGCRGDTAGHVCRNAGARGRSCRRRGYARCRDATCLRTVASSARDPRARHRHAGQGDAPSGRRPLRGSPRAR